MTDSNIALDSLGLSNQLVLVLQELGFTSFTPIQTQSVPFLLKGKDLIGQSSTGSGKTAAFTLPILEKLKTDQREVQALVLCPTRELCTQVAREMRKLGRRHSGLQVVILSGGQPMGPQLDALEQGAHIAVGTPGRVLDHLNRRKLDLSRVSTVVLDEADRMLEMGFQEDMEKILSNAPRKRQTVLFSATFPEKIEILSRAYQRSPVRVTIESKKETAPAIRQQFYEVEVEYKLKTLIWLIRQHQPESAIVFCNLKSIVSEIEKIFNDLGVSAAGLHGDLEQSARDRVMAKFRNGSTRILIATDVAARGIDIADLDMVFNFDIPKPDIYVHRIGRTGRAGKKGHAITIGAPRDKSKIEAIEEYTKTKLERKVAPSNQQLEAEVAKKILNEDAKMETLYISGGRKEKLRPTDILGALTGEAGGLKGSHIGKIEIHDRFAYVAVSRNVAHLALERLRNGKIKGRKFKIEKVR